MIKRQFRSKMTIDPAKPVPLYIQVARQLRLEIAFGDTAPGDRLPTVRELAERAGVHRNTAARAIRHLAREGVVQSRVGRGTVVGSSSPSLDRNAMEAAAAELMEELLGRVHALGVPLEEIGWRLSRAIERFRRRIDDDTRD
jgi:GntR family transcriptional regulator